ncbi:MAG: ABC transporter ATP-binding protein [Candidatus Methanoperedens sp.]|nr:ABC transporter ATP-binding protein [Candidatus Methanoperedens sp.]MCE8427300.1 ABC transporter ATP-binding protein [Candidatus Methanoperedens sp.]
MAEAIIVSDLGKIFRIPHEKRSTLFEHITGVLYGKKGYEEFLALKNINFTVKKGEAVGIIGENGSGKSTLLKIIANILRPSSGSITIIGKITPFLELGVGFQPDLTAKENIYIYAAIMGLSDREIDGKLEEILEFSGLKQFQDAKLKNLSSGMQVRLAFATAVQTNPEILLMDEVLAVGDMDFQQKCLDVFQRYLKEKKTIVFVSHDLNSVRRFCSKALLLRHGEQVAFGDTNEIIDKYVYGVDDKAKHAKNLQSESKKEEQKSVDGKIEEKKTRWGNKKVEITSVKFIDKFGKENAVFNSGDTMTILINYDVNATVDHLVIGIAIYFDSDMLCYGTNTEIKGFDVMSKQGTNEIKLCIHNLSMMEGKFKLTVAAHSIKHVPYDWLDKQFSFNVIKKGNNAGLFEIPCEWKK